MTATTQAGRSAPDGIGQASRGGSGRFRVTGLWAVALVAVGAAVAQAFGRFTYGLVLPAILGDLGISKSVAGSIGTANVGAYLLGTVAVAALTSKVRLLMVLRVGFVFSISGLVLAATASSPLVLGIGLFLTGLGGAFIWIPSPVIAADAMPPEKRRLAIGLMSTGIGLGVVFSGQLASMIRSASGDPGWRTVYLVQASIGVVVALATFAFIGHSQDRPTTKGGVGGFSALRRMRGWVPLTCAYTSFGFMYLLVIGYLTTRLEDDSGWTASKASLAFTLAGLAMVVGGPTFIALAGRLGTRMSLALAFTFWAGLVLAVLPGWTVPTFAASLGIGMVFAGVPATITMYVVENTTPDDYGPSYSAATLAFGVTQMLAPQIGGLVADLSGSFALVFLLSAGFALTGTVAALQLPRRDGHQ